MKNRWALLALLLAFAIASCVPSQSSTHFPSETLIPTLEDEEMISNPTPDDAAQKMVALAKEHLARSLSIAVNEIVLFEVKPVLWPDASLGCPKPNIDYIRAETPGYRILLEASGKTYSLHTNQTNRVILCRQ